VARVESKQLLRPVDIRVTAPGSRCALGRGCSDTVAISVWSESAADVTLRYSVVLHRAAVAHSRPPHYASIVKHHLAALPVGAVRAVTVVQCAATLSSSDTYKRTSRPSAPAACSVMDQPLCCWDRTSFAGVYVASYSTSGAHASSWDILWADSDHHLAYGP
jgi:hypothetical protein